ncbi:MAG TPA: hypothetical protein VFP84_02650, partial [Kofleriaceae bacterium]|nr:hypothetical protein [Kofleriaceae bacterium]
PRGHEVGLAWPRGGSGAVTRWIRRGHEVDPARPRDREPPATRDGSSAGGTILDRLAMHAIRIDITGPSYRQHIATLRAERAPKT